MKTRVEVWIRSDDEAHSGDRMHILDYDLRIIPRRKDTVEIPAHLLTNDKVRYIKFLDDETVENLILYVKERNFFLDSDETHVELLCVGVNARYRTY